MRNTILILLLPFFLYFGLSSFNDDLIAAPIKVSAIDTTKTLFYKIKKHRQSAAIFCDYNRIEVSPDGKYVLLWEEELEATLVTTTLWNPKVDKAQMFTLGDDSSIFSSKLISSAGRISPIGWTKDGLLISQLGEYNIATINAQSVKIEEIYKLSKPLDNIRFSSTVDNQIDLKNSVNNINKLISHDDLDLEMAFIINGKDEIVLFAEDDNRQLLKISSAGKQTALNFKTSFLRQPSLPPSSTSLEIINAGDSVNENDINPKALSTPLYDKNTGKLVGRFSPTSINIYNDDDLTQTILKNLPSDALIRDILYRNGEATILYRNPQNSSIFTIINEQGVRATHYLCKDSLMREAKASKKPLFKVRNALTAIPPVINENDNMLTNSQFEDAVLSTNSIQNKSIGIVYKNSMDSVDKGRPLIIYAHGGPSINLWNAGFPKRVERFKKFNVDVLYLTYPGSAGLGLDNSAALLKDGFKSMDTYALNVKEWIESKRYDNIVMVGSSFGAVPTMAISNVLNQSLCHIHYVVPFLGLRKYEEMFPNPNSRRDEYSREKQKKFVDDVFGGLEQTKEINKWIAARNSDHSLTNKTYSYFSKIDNLIDYKDRPKTWDYKKYTLLEKTPHSFAEAQELVIKSIDQSINKCFSI